MIIIIAYTICLIFIYFISNIQYKADIRRHGVMTCHKLSWVSVVLFTILIVWINYIYTYSPEFSMPGDRRNYSYDYDRNISVSSGLLSIYSLARYLNFDFNSLALLVTSLSIPLVFIAYKYAKGATPLMLLFFFLTAYVINGFDNFKQTFTNAFACIFFALTTFGPSFKNDILCIGAVILACMFHPTGFILILFYAIYRFNIRTGNNVALLLCVVLCTMFMQEIMMLIAQLVGGAMPFLTDKILQYFAEGSDMGEGKLMVALKGSVYFYITAMLIIHKKFLATKIYNFDLYLIVGYFICSLYLLSYYNVWMPRMAELFFFPMMLCWARSIRFLPNKALNIFITCFLTGFFTYRLMWLSYVNPIN